MAVTLAPKPTVQAPDRQVPQRPSSSFLSLLVPQLHSLTTFPVLSSLLSAATINTLHCTHHLRRIVPSLLHQFAPIYLLPFSLSPLIAPHRSFSPSCSILFALSSFSSSLLPHLSLSPSSPSLLSPLSFCLPTVSCLPDKGEANITLAKSESLHPTCIPPASCITLVQPPQHHARFSLLPDVDLASTHRHETQIELPR